MIKTDMYGLLRKAVLFWSLSVELSDQKALIKEIDKTTSNTYYIFIICSKEL